ncbi:hypothetical protein STRIC_2482 [Streptococcus ictaluri 707-05]|uniref:Phosphoglycerate mutase domain protein n=1 Tax=Streptococcus ictaluri 707-05 TaxID=764299 RepID=G5K274_9STRE|nr:hypothetical protein STRIC_2482 [Streptococcus ictaluri 707-05]
MKLYFVRHGKTLWNVEGRFQVVATHHYLKNQKRNLKH